MGEVHQRRLKKVIFELDGDSFEAQVSTWKLNNGTKTGDTMYVYSGDTFVEDKDPDYTLELKFYSDWRSGGISDYLASHDQQTVDFTIDHLPDIPAEHVTWTGRVHITSPDVGGDVRDTEVQEFKGSVVGTPVYSRAGA